MWSRENSVYIEYIKATKYVINFEGVISQTQQEQTMNVSFVAIYGPWIKHEIAGNLI